MLLLALAELWIGGVPDGFWQFFFWGMAVGLPILFALFFMDELRDLCQQAAQCCKARQAVGKEGGLKRTAYGLLQDLCVLLLRFSDLIYHILKIHPADRHIV